MQYLDWTTETITEPTSRGGDYVCFFATNKGSAVAWINGMEIQPGETIGPDAVAGAIFTTVRNIRFSAVGTHNLQITTTILRS